MLAYCFATIFALFYYYGQMVNSDATIVEWELGKIKGTVLKTEKGADFFAFRGIPYAKPPVGSLRFKAPIEVEPWEEVLDASKYGNDCLQSKFMDSSQIEGNEDCLYLNVFTPSLPTNNSEPMAVIVFIHGGFLLVGSSMSGGPVKLLDKGIVFVTFNYRLGAMGFLCTEDEESPGNYALFDQLEALRWVKRHISVFNGDPSRVTLTGPSAGATAVTLQMLSPLSAGLFYAAILHSGSVVSDRFVEYNPLLQAQRLAEKLNCPTDNTKTMVHCLQGLPGEDITMATTSIRESSELNGTFPFRPVIDKYYTEHAFLPGPPKKLFQQGKFHHVPTISGVTKDEGVFYYLAFANGPKVGRSAEEVYRVKDYEAILPIFAQEFFRDKSKGVQFTKEMTETYLPNHQNATIRGLMKGIFEVLSDTSVTSYTDITNEFIASNGVPVYAYKVTFLGSNSQFKLMPGRQFIPADMSTVAHGDDFQFLYSHNITQYMNAEEDIVANIMTTIWTTFAKTRVPSLPSDLCSETTVWRPLLSKSGADYSYYLDINPNPAVVNEILSDRTVFLAKLKQLISERSESQRADL